MKTDKFLLSTSTILGSVEEAYIKFVGDHWDDPDLDDLLKELIQKSTKHRVHLKLVMSTDNVVIVETSKYVLDQGFTDHQIWVFRKWMKNKYSIHLTRYNINFTNLKFT